MKTVKYVLVALVIVLSMSYPVKAALVASVIKMPWGYDIMIENDTEFEGFQAIEINSQRDLYYVIPGTEKTVFRCVILTDIKERPVVKIIKRVKENIDGSKE